MSAPDPTRDPTPRQSLWRDLTTGSAGVGTKVVVSLALAGLLSGAALIASYVLAAAVPPWSYGSYYGSGIYPREELVGVLLLIASAAFLAATVWLWSRNTRKHRAVWLAAMVTIGIAAVTAVLGFAADVFLSRTGESEYVVGGIVCVGASAALLVWVQAFRRYGGPAPLRDRDDGRVDLRCPACGYRMVGLGESRCPECGAAYTLDELFIKQDFARRLTPATPPPLPASTNEDGNNGAAAR